MPKIEQLETLEKDLVLLKKNPMTMTEFRRRSNVSTMSYGGFAEIVDYFCRRGLIKQKRVRNAIILEWNGGKYDIL